MSELLAVNITIIISLCSYKYSALTIIGFRFFGETTGHFILYAAIIVSVVWFLIKSQTWSLIKTKRLLKEKEDALSQIEFRRSELEYKNKEITDSLNYAQRIQDALLPSEDYIKQYFTDSFIFFRPKDIVSGDFYWIEEKGDKTYVIVADCTGHGVPGAMMSMIGLEMLGKIINDDNLEQPSEILDLMNKILEKTFNRSKTDGAIIRDGMDIGICLIDKGKKRVEYSGSFLPLYLLRDKKLIEIKADKLTLGFQVAGVNFKNNEMELLENDIFYLFSDGYVDQFGGEEDKKFMYRRFRYLLMTIHGFPMTDQKAILDENLRSWRGNITQVDDVMVIGFKPL